MSRGTEYLNSSGRHHPDNARAWTPEVPAQARASRRGAHEPPSRVAPNPPASNTHGHLSGELPAIPAPRRQQGAAQAETARYQASHGELPVEPPPDHEGEQAPRRTRVSFSELEPATHVPGQQTEPARSAETGQGHRDADDELGGDLDDDAAGAEAVPNGLGMFDLGSVPASVTPPSTWRRAAWFAAASSGGVMGLLFAGTFLLGQQPTQPQAAEQWSYLNRRGGSPLFDRDELLSQTNRVPAPGYTSVTGTGPRQSSSQESTSAGPDSGGPPASASSVTSRGGAGAPSAPTTRTGTQAPPTSGASSTANTTTTSSSSPMAPTTTQIPEKPPPRTPESEVVNPHRGFVAAAHDWREMAKVSNNYLNTVTEDPQRARQYTTGELHAKGADGLRRKYARIAYFEVRKITVNEGKGITVNTVEVVYKDGHTEIQERTLTFSDNGKISRARR